MVCLRKNSNEEGGNSAKSGDVIPANNTMESSDRQRYNPDSREGNTQEWSSFMDNISIILLGYADYLKKKGELEK